jgi:ATP-dependent DNA helicase RecG
LSGIFDTKIEFLKGVGPQKAALINKELNLFTFGELIQHYPFRYEDRTKFFKIREITAELENVQIIGKIRQVELIGLGPKRRLVAHVVDETGEMDMTWFKGIQWVQPKLPAGATFIFYGKPALYGRKWSRRIS